MAGIGQFAIWQILVQVERQVFFSRFPTDAFRRLMITVCGLAFFVIGIAVFLTFVM